jgi:pyridoxal phosphate enzyme (YggS family)
MESLKSILAGNFKAVEDRIREACARSGRERPEVTLIAVSKTVDAAAVVEAVALGQLDFGENYVQPAQSKMEEVRRQGAAGARFHMIGHLQRNKARAALAVFESLHSLDSRRLLAALEKELAGGGREFPCFVEVNVSGEDSKYGIVPDDAPGFVEAALEAGGVKVEGLMTMAPLLAQPEECRPYFARLRELRDRINEKLGRRALGSLSMGMTNDFEVAVEEGATHLRIGTALFKA